MNTERQTEFERAGDNVIESSFVVEIAAYLKANRKWWLLPIFASLLAMGAILALSGTAAAPFIYTLF